MTVILLAEWSSSSVVCGNVGAEQIAYRLDFDTDCKMSNAQDHFARSSLQWSPALISASA
jgi:hypothetical protein